MVSQQFFHILKYFKIEKEISWRPLAESSTLKDKDSESSTVSFFKQTG